MYENVQNASPIADAIERLRANPEIISMVASALSSSADNTDEDAKAMENDMTTKEEKANDTPVSSPNIGDLVSSLAPMLSSMSPRSGKSDSEKARNPRNPEREALLCALKPYVSENRRTAIDYVIRISQISEMFKALN